MFFIYPFVVLSILHNLFIFPSSYQSSPWGDNHQYSMIYSTPCLSPPSIFQQSHPFSLLSSLYILPGCTLVPFICATRSLAAWWALGGTLQGTMYFANPIPSVVKTQPLLHHFLVIISILFVPLSSSFGCTFTPPEHKLSENKPSACFHNISSEEEGGKNERMCGRVQVAHEHSWLEK